MTASDKITALLGELHNGNDRATAELMPLVYSRLRQIAARHLAGERRHHTWCPTDLLHETYLRLIKPGTGPWRSRAHFFGVASRATRQVLVDYARARNAARREGRLLRVELNRLAVCDPASTTEFLEFHEALGRLEDLDRRQSRIVELRYFAGLTVKETAEVLRVSVATVKADWALAKAWLQRELAPKRP
jgi:RNA polymerase sigma-70 factor, ECF subfamily